MRNQRLRLLPFHFPAVKGFKAYTQGAYFDLNQIAWLQRVHQDIDGVAKEMTFIKTAWGENLTIDSPLHSVLSILEENDKEED